MTCNQCNQHITYCMCDDFEERIDALRKSMFLDIDWDLVLAYHKLNEPAIAKMKASKANSILGNEK